MKKSKIGLTISITLITILIAFFGFKLLSNDNIPSTVISISVVDTNDNSKIEITGADSERIVQLANGEMNHFEYPSCAGSNIELQFHTKTKTFYRQICGDDCGTLWNEDGNSFSIPEDDMKEIKGILSNYDIEVLPQ